jgi:hypothetical protein
LERGILRGIHGPPAFHAAAALCADKCVQNSTSNVTKDQLNADYKQMQSWGTFQGTMVVPQSWNYMNENGTVKLAGACVYSGGGQHRFTMTLSETGGSRKVDSYQWLP